jgi:hypothetical protein
MNCEQLLLNLLAVIHRDGGHHTSEVGVEQSVEDAYNVINELKLQIDDLKFNH